MSFDCKNFHSHTKASLFSLPSIRTRTRLGWKQGTTHPTSPSFHQCPLPPNQLKEVQNPSVQNNELAVLQGKSPDQITTAERSVYETLRHGWGRVPGGDHTPETPPLHDPRGSRDTLLSDLISTWPSGCAWKGENAGHGALPRPPGRNPGAQQFVTRQGPHKLRYHSYSLVR